MKETAAECVGRITFQQLILLDKDIFGYKCAHFALHMDLRT
jgi:hypothetical protein